MKKRILAVHEASGQDITFQEEVAYALASGGGKPGQCYPCILIINDEDIRNSDERERRMLDD